MVSFGVWARFYTGSYTGCQTGARIGLEAKRKDPGAHPEPVPALKKAKAAAHSSRFARRQGRLENL